MGDTSKILIRWGLIIVVISVVVFVVVGVQRIMVSLTTLQQNNLATVERLIDDPADGRGRSENVDSPIVRVRDEMSEHQFPNTLLTQSVLCELA